MNLIPTDNALPYLRVQKGQLDNVPDGQEFWSGYLEVTRKDFETIRPHLPFGCRSLLDIGGGMGGVDILITRHYEGLHRQAEEGVRAPAPRVTILDGMEDSPKVEMHRKTFSNMWVAGEFMIANGVSAPYSVSPELAKLAASEGSTTDHYDLVISLGAWCFHLQPSEYLDYVKLSTHRGSVVVVDMRRDRGQWQKQMSDELRATPKVIWQGHPKFDRLVYRVG